MMNRPLNLEENDRKNCTITFNLNRFEIYHANGWLMSASNDVGRLEDIIGLNRLECTFDAFSKKMYLKYQTL